MADQPPELSEDEARRIFDQFFKPLCSRFQRWGATWEQSRDLAQETLLRAFRGMEGFRRKSSLGTWIFTIALNLWRNSLRGAFREDLSLEETGGQNQAGGSAPVLKDPAPSPEARAASLEERQRLRTALDRLPPKARRVMELHLRQFTYSDIARLLQIRLGTVKSHLHQARSQLKEHLVSSAFESGNRP